MLLAAVVKSKRLPTFEPGLLKLQVLPLRNAGANECLRLGRAEIRPVVRDEARVVGMRAEPRMEPSQRPLEEAGVRRVRSEPKDVQPSGLSVRRPSRAVLVKRRERGVPKSCDAADRRFGREDDLELAGDEPLGRMIGAPRLASDEQVTRRRKLNSERVDAVEPVSARVRQGLEGNRDHVLSGRAHLLDGDGFRWRRFRPGT